MTCIKCLANTYAINVKPLTYIDGYRVEASGLEICEDCKMKSVILEELPQLLRLVDSLRMSCCPSDAVIIRYDDGWILT